MHMLLDLLKTQGVKAGLAFLEKAELEGRSGDRGTNRFLSQTVITISELMLVIWVSCIQKQKL